MSECCAGHQSHYEASYNTSKDDIAQIMLLVIPYIHGGRIDVLQAHDFVALKESRGGNVPRQVGRLAAVSSLGDLG